MIPPPEKAPSSNLIPRSGPIKLKPIITTIVTEIDSTLALKVGEAQITAISNEFYLALWSQAQKQPTDVFVSTVALLVKHTRSLQKIMGPDSTTKLRGTMFALLSLSERLITKGQVDWVEDMKMSKNDLSMWEKKVLAALGDKILVTKKQYEVTAQEMGFDTVRSVVPVPTEMDEKRVVEEVKREVEGSPVNGDWAAVGYKKPSMPS